MVEAELKLYYVQTTTNKIPLEYKRTKEGIEIKGDPEDVRGLAKFDLVTSKLPKIGTIFFFLKLPVAQWLSLSLHWIKRQLPFI